MFVNVNQPLAQRDQPDGLGHQADHQDGEADLGVQQGVPGGSGGFQGFLRSKALALPGVPAQRWLHRADDPKIRCQL